MRERESLGSHKPIQGGKGNARLELHVRPFGLMVLVVSFPPGATSHAD